MITNENKVKSLIEKEKLIVIVRNVESKKLIPLAEAMFQGGIKLLEITYSANKDISNEQTAKDIDMLSKKFEGKMCIGAGTVLTKEQVELTYNAGGQFIISPDTRFEVINKTKELKMVSIPGALTPTEIQTANLFGADFVKLFPITSLGTNYIKAIRTPLSHIKLLAVGGITENNIQEYLSTGICGFGVGSNIVDKKLIDTNNWTKITDLAKKYLNALQYKEN